MEPEIREFLLRVAKTVFMGLLWMMVNSTIGIMFDLAFIHENISIFNIIFYVWFLITLALLVWYYVRLWKKPLDDGNILK
jgi:hypothetical protein